MKVIFETWIGAKSQGMTLLWKVMELPFAPSVGMEVDDPVLDPNERRLKVERVTLSLGYSDDPPKLLVSLGTLGLGTPAKVKEYVEMYKAHGWQLAGRE